MSLRPRSMAAGPRDPGRVLARILCALFAVVGALPVVAGWLVGTPTALRWAAGETARVLQQELGVTATYAVDLQVWPPRVELRDLVVPSNDGGAPALTARRVSVAPRVFSLLAGRLDVGDVELEEPAARIVLRDGELTNVSYRLPERRGPARRLDRAPFTSLSVSGATVAVEAEDVVATTSAVDVDVFAEPGPSFEIALHGGETHLTRTRTSAEESATRTAMDEDVVCLVDARVRAEPDSVLIRRLSVGGFADDDEARGTRPMCATSAEDVRRVLVRLSQVRVDTAAEKPSASGHVLARGPMRILNRFVDTLPFSGWVSVSAEVTYGGSNELPTVRGRVEGKGIHLGGYRLGERVEADLRIEDDVIVSPTSTVDFANGRVTVQGLQIAPLHEKVTLRATRVDARGMNFPGFMRDLDVTENTVVHWDHDRVIITELGGTLAPLKLDGELDAHTSDFEVFDRAYHDPARRHMIGVRAASLRGKIAVRPTAFEFVNTRATFGNSSLVTSVSLGFDNDIKLTVSEGSRIDLSDITPLVDIPMAGVVELAARMGGKFGDPLLTGEMKIKDFEFGGFPIGQVLSSKVRFRPLVVDLVDVRGRKGKSNFVVPTARLDFDTRATVVAEADVRSEDLDLRDFFAMWHFDSDPRFDPLFGRGKVAARVHYELGGPRDACGGGVLRVGGRMDMGNLDLFEEQYDRGEATFDFRWLDRDASYLGIEVDVPSMTLTKGDGVALGSFQMRSGGVVKGHAVATAVPLSRLQSLGALAGAAEARVSAVAEAYGTIDELYADAHVTVSPARIGSRRLPSSDFALNLVPVERERVVVGRTPCGRPVTPEFDRKDYDQDRRQGVFHMTGQLFGGQVRFDDLQVTRQRSKVSWGKVLLRDLDLSALGELAPTSTGESRMEGRLSADLAIEEMPLDRFAESRATIDLGRIRLAQGGLRVDLLPGAGRISVGGGRLQIPGLALAATTPGGHTGIVDVTGSVDDLGRDPQVSARVVVRPTDLSTFAALIPRAERASGALSGALSVSGPVRGLRYRGNLELTDGEIAVRGLPTPLSNLQLALAVDGDEIRITRGSAELGGGTIHLQGSAPLIGYALGEARATITVRGVNLPIVPGVKSEVDADVVATIPADAEEGAPRPLPSLDGSVTLRSFEYTRPVTMAADISTIARRGRRTQFEAYDPDDDLLQFDITLRSPRPLKVRNNLVEAELEIDREGLVMVGTNQRFGARGNVNVKPGGRIQFRRSEFEVQQGTIRFEDPTRVAPQVDVTARTDYRRYSSSGVSDGTATDTASAAAGGQWNITMHAYGDAEKLRIDLTSEPELAQDDIFLLLTLGLTRAELDQAQSASLGESVALEALGTLTGADTAVTQALPVIDEFRFGSAYSTKTGRTEPTVTVGKRLAERIRAHVTSGLAESREIRSNLEWRLSPRVSVEGSYDNVNDISSSSLGNLGADVRWRLEFD